MKRRTRDRDWDRWSHRAGLGSGDDDAWIAAVSIPQQLIEARTWLALGLSPSDARDLRGGYLGTLRHTAILDPAAIENLAELREVVLSAPPRPLSSLRDRELKLLAHAVEWLLSASESGWNGQDEMIVQSVRVKNAWGVLASMGVTVAQLLKWAGAGYEPGLAVPWIDAGFDTPDGATAWATFRPTHARKWREYRFKPSEAAQWSATGIGPADSRAWCSAGFSPELAQQCLRHGVRDPRQAIAWTEVGFSSEDASSWTKSRFEPSEAAQWSATGIGPAGSRAWCSAGFPPELAQQWLRHGVGDPRHALKWIDAGFDDVTASPWLHAGVAPDDAKGFDAHGVSAEDLRDIAADHRSLGHVQPWLDAGFSVVDFRRWHDGGFSYEHAVPWLEHQFAPHDAATWRSHRFDAAEAGEWRDVGISPRAAARWRDSGVTCDVARRRSNAGLQPPT